MEEGTAPGQRAVVTGPCATCGEEVEYVYQTETIPYLSDILIFSDACQACGYRYTNTQMLHEGKPERQTFSVTSPDGLREISATCVAFCPARLNINATSAAPVLCPNSLAVPSIPLAPPLR